VYGTYNTVIYIPYLLASIFDRSARGGARATAATKRLRWNTSECTYYSYRRIAVLAVARGFNSDVP
jgi:hypothetical protein